LAFGIAAVIGHLFPIYTGFRGGKGIATMLGLLIGLQPYAAFFSLIIFVIIFFIFRYVSLASMIASIAFPFFVMIILSSTNEPLNLFAIFVPILSLITHQKNIERLIRKEETKVKFGKK
jgi:glycerol-3-phosphate acyltransferase PlsY